MQVAIRELKNHLSKYLKQVQTGAEIIVTTHGKPVARFCQLESAKEPFSTNLLQNIPWVRKCQNGKPKGLPANLRIKPSSGKSLSDIMLEDRE